MPAGNDATRIPAPPVGGLYDASYEHDACGVGFVVNIKGKQSHAIVEQALTVLKNLTHRGACGCEENTGDGAGIAVQIPHRFLLRETAGLGFTPDPSRNLGQRIRALWQALVL